MKTRRGDVVLVLFPNSDLRTAKRRPVLVLQRDNLASGLGQTIVAMISSSLARRGAEVDLELLNSYGEKFKVGPELIANCDEFSE